MGMKSLIESVYLERSSRTLRRVGVVGELVNAANIPLFTITGGPIKATLVGILTADFVVTATTVQLLQGAVPLGLACTTLSGQLTGIHLNPTGAVGAAIAISAGINVGVYQATPWSLGVGIIRLLVGGATSAVAAIDWYLSFDPLVPGASVAIN